MIHSERSVAAELERVRERPAAPPAPAAFGVDVAEGSAEAYARRVRDVLSAALRRRTGDSPGGHVGVRGAIGDGAGRSVRRARGPGAVSCVRCLDSVP
jgi:hypothetical protein